MAEVENKYQIVSPKSSTSLADLPVNTEGTVLDVGGDRAVARRLMEMGVLPGTQVRVVRVAPLGDPIELSVRSYSLSIRRAEARGIRVAPGTGSTR